jgi:hypothetical protein
MLWVVLAVVVVIVAVGAWLLYRQRSNAAAASEALPPLETPVATTGRVEVASVHHGVTDADSGEWVMVVNNDYRGVRIGGWRLTDQGAKHAYAFPDIVIPADGRLRVHMWSGDDTASDVYVGRKQHWWNNEGDCALLYDSSGTLIHQYCYGQAETA